MTDAVTADRVLSEDEIFALERPRPSLFTCYALCSLLAGPFFFAPLAVLFFRYRTLRYRFDDEGISMRWGILFRREIHLTYARIQDIHLTSNVVERWIGLARIKIQTASGSSKAEMTIEGIEAFEDLRDFLYARMRGAHRHDAPAANRADASAVAGVGPDIDAAAAVELTATLRQVAEELRALRLTLEERSGDV